MTDISIKLLLLLKVHFHQLLPSIVQAGLAEEEAAAASHRQQSPVKIHTRVFCHHNVFITFSIMVIEGKAC